MQPFKLIAPVSDRVGESPVWDARQRALWWVDIEGCCVRRWHLPTETLQRWQLPERVGCIALADDGRVIAALESRIVAAWLGDDASVQLQDLARLCHPAPGMRFNDGRCDAAGRLWVGSMVMDMGSAQARGALYRLDEHGLSEPLVEGLLTPNGSAFSPDTRIFYLSDSHPAAQQVWAFDFEVQRGELSRRRLFADLRTLPGRPDGAAVDREGAYWVCGNDAGVVHRFSPDGELLRSLPVPFPKPAMCCFGGDRLDTLFVTSIVPVDCALDTHRLSGAVVALDPGVAGLPEPRFSRYPETATLAPA